MSERRFGVLIASSRFSDPKLQNLRCPENDVDGINEVLKSNDYGNFAETFLLKNEPHGEILRTINNVLKKLAKKGDLVLIYYSGHGKLNAAGRLHLITADTEDDLLESTSIPIDIIKSYIDVSPANKFVLVLDSCFSGAAGNAFATTKGDVDGQFQLISGGKGTYILTASTGIQVAKENEEDMYGVFTKHIIEGIKTGGAANDRGLVTMDTLYSYVHDKVLSESHQEPMKWDLNVRGEIVIARSVKPKVLYKKTRTESASKNKLPSILPERLSGLLELAYNLWWSWNPEARQLFKMLSRNEWYLSSQNPVKMLRNLDKAILQEAAKNPQFLTQYDAVMALFESEMDVSGGWFGSNAIGSKSMTIAYFSAEYGLHHALPFYAGGQGIMAGDFLKESSDLGIPLVGIGLMYPEGYLRQEISPDGWQTGASEILDHENSPIRQVLDANGKALSIKFSFVDPPILLDVWKVQVGRTPLFLIDTSNEDNEPWSRCISDRLYTEDPEQRLRRDIVLGIGGIRILKALGIDYTVLHLNEGHTALAILERIREKVEGGMSYCDAFDQVRETTVFTTHTPALADHDMVTFQLMDKYFDSYLPGLKLSREEFFKLGMDPTNTSSFNMSTFALRSSAHCNAVSKRQREISRRIWNKIWPELPEEKVPIDYITNGIHVPSWVDRRLGDIIMNRYLGRRWLSSQNQRRTWGLIDAIPDEVLWNHHLDMKNLLMTRLRALDSRSDPRKVMASGVVLDPTVLTLGYAHQFTACKRPTLLFQDEKRLRSILNNTKWPVQIIFAGKAPPNDKDGKLLIQQVFKAAMDSSYCGSIAFVEDYDVLLAQYLAHGVDLWINSSLPPTETSGISGMKATLNGVPLLSILDGWWMEGYNGRNGWAIAGAEGQDRDAKDAAAIYDLLEKQIVPLFYNVDEGGVSHGWVTVMKETIKMTGPNFSTRRMVREYAHKFYNKAINAAIRMEYTGTKVDLFTRI